MGLKKSRYNFFFEPDDGYILAYNGFSNSLARVTIEKYNIIKEILKNPNGYCYDSEKKEKLKNDLLEGSFLIDENIDEIDLLKMKNRIGRFSKEIFGLTIAPTLDCNFKCSYCFEERKNESISHEVEIAILKFVEKNIEKAKGFGVTWFGGEPLLKIDTIARLVKSFKKLCKKYNVHFFPQEIITNGSLLTRKNAELLKELNINRAQITIDGPPVIHNERRKFINGEGTFDEILNNIKKSMDIINITIRINIDKDNFKEIDTLYDILEKNDIFKKVPLYLGRVTSFNEACANVSSKCFNVKDFSSIVIDAMKSRKGKKARLSAQYPLLLEHGACCADKINSFVLTPNGNLFKCWSETTFEEKNSVGNIFTDNLKPYQQKNLAKYINWDPFEKENCMKCNYLPICAGGCPFFALNSLEKCTSWKYYIKEMLMLKYIDIKENLKKRS